MRVHVQSKYMLRKPSICTTLQTRCSQFKYQSKSQLKRTIKVKELIDEIVENYDSRPKMIYNKLQLNMFKNSIDVMPSYEQVVNYIGNMWRTMGDTNDIDKVEQLVENELNTVEK